MIDSGTQPGLAGADFVARLKEAGGFVLTPCQGSRYFEVKNMPPETWSAQAAHFRKILPTDFRCRFPVFITHHPSFAVA
jgi:hypothetical protein